VPAHARGTPSNAPQQLLPRVCLCDLLLLPALPLLLLRPLLCALLLNLLLRPLLRLLLCLLLCLLRRLLLQRVWVH
jgi:hypothetical protein